jgi:hypothetical protein
MMVAALLCPPAAFGLLMWLTRLEDTLPRDVRAGMRRPDPPPILAVPDHGVPPAASPPPPATTGARRQTPIPSQRTPAALERAPQPD